MTDEIGRIHSMDALRASSMFLLVPVHAAILLAVNGHGGAWSSALYWAVHLFRLPLFFAMSGFFLVLLLSSRGLPATARNRTARIVGPLAIGLLTLVPLLVWASQAADVSIAGDGTVAGDGAFVPQPSYLWFLWYLLLLDAAAVAAHLTLPALLRDGSARMLRALARPLPGIGLLALVTALAIWPSASWMVEPATDTFLPEPAALLYYALFFAFGAALCAHRGALATLAENAWSWAVCALAAIVPAAALYTLHNSALGAEPALHALALVAYAVATWTSLIALVALANRYLVRSRPRLRYLADSSYWIYLSHMPAMVLAIGLVGLGTIGTAPAFVLVTATSLAFSLLTYPLLVRYAPLGRLLNGRRERSPQRHRGPLPTASRPRLVAVEPAPPAGHE